MAGRRKHEVLPAGELEARYMKLLKKRRGDEEAKYYDITIPWVRQERRLQNVDGNEGPNRLDWGSISRQILQPEDPRHNQPSMRKKTDPEVLFATRSDVWLVQEESTDQGSLIEFILYIIFLVIGIIIIYAVLEVGYNYYAASLSRVFTQTPFNTSLGITKTFEEIRTVEQLWEYIDQVFLKVMYGYSENHPRSAKIDQAGVFWLFENVLVGIPRIRQLRVKNGSCSGAAAVKDMFPSCYGYYSDGWMDTEPFGLRTPATWRFSEANSGSASYRGKISNYGGGGYMVNITRDAAQTKALIRELIDSRWIRKGARAIFIDFTTYTPNNNLFCVVKLVFELPPTGGVIPTDHFYAMRFLRYVNSLDYVVFGAEVGFVGFTIWYTLQEVLELLIRRRRYFFSLWNFIDIAILGISYFTILAGLYRYTLVTIWMQTYVDQIALGHHQSFDSFVEAQLTMNTGIAILSFLVWFKLLRFAVLFKSMAVIYSVFGRIKHHVLSLATLMLVTIFGFALVATMLFGGSVAQFTTLWNSLFSLVGLFFGGFYFYPQCAAAHETLAPAFFMLYIFMVFLLLVNVYVALVVYGFWKAVEVLEDQRERAYIADIIYKVLHRILWLFCAKKKAAQVKEKMEAERNKKSYKELLRIVKKHGFRGNALIILFQKHQIYPAWPLPFSKVSEVYEEVDTWTQLYMEISEHDRLMSNVAKSARKVELLDRAVSDMMINVEVLVADLLYEEQATS